jgi:MFS superfamily sulfate permease-like transporter
MSNSAAPALVHPIPATDPAGSARQKRRASTDLTVVGSARAASRFSAESIRRDALAGSITGLLALPLTVGICLMSEYPIQVGLLTVVFACVIGFITFLFRPGNYVGTPGVAAGLAPVLAMSVHKFGMENMPLLIFMTSVMQALAWRFNWQRFILKAIPNYLIEGLLAGIGLKIALKFLPYTFGVVTERAEYWSMDRIKIIALSIGALWLFLHLFGKYKAKYPAVPYVAVILLGLVAGHYCTLPMLHIEPSAVKLAVPFANVGSLPPKMLLEIFGYAVMLGLIDVIEQVTSNAAIEKLDPLGRPANTNNSLLAIWVANLGSSFFGGMTNLDGLAKSATNALAGAVTKLSNLFTALVLGIFVLEPHWLEHLPYFALAVLMIFTGWKMVSGLVHVAAHGRYELILALFCGILTYTVGIFEGLLVTLGVHLFVNFVIFRHEHLPLLQMLKRLAMRFSEPTHPHTTPTMVVHSDKEIGGMHYSSVRRNPADQKQLTDFINDWAFGINTHSIPAVVGTYDYNGLLWGTFAKELREGHHNINGYFEHLFELKNVHVRFESAEVRQYKDIYIQSGKYVFTFDRKEQHVTVPARYSFVCKKERMGWFILEHHSSEFPA